MWLFLMWLNPLIIWPSEKLERRGTESRVRLGNAGVVGTGVSIFGELEKRLELLLLCVDALRLMFPIARYSGPSSASLGGSSGLAVSSLWLVIVLILISLTGEKGSLGDKSLVGGMDPVTGSDTHSL